jgi:hypothetical protein
MLGLEARNGVRWQIDRRSGHRDAAASPNPRRWASGRDRMTWPRVGRPPDLWRIVNGMSRHTRRRLRMWSRRRGSRPEAGRSNRMSVARINWRRGVIDGRCRHRNVTAAPNSQRRPSRHRPTADVQSGLINHANNRHRNCSHMNLVFVKVPISDTARPSHLLFRRL